MLCRASGHLLIYRGSYGFERVFCTLRRFFYLAVFPAVFKVSLGVASSTSRLAGLHVHLWNIAPARQFVWITAIHKRFICDRFYLIPRANQSRNISLHGELVLQNISLHGELTLWNISLIVCSAIIVEPLSVCRAIIVEPWILASCRIWNLFTTGEPVTRWACYATLVITARL